MTRQRFYAPPGSFNTRQSFITLSAEETRHLRDVLRLAAGDPAFVFDGEGHEFECTIIDVNGDSARLKPLSEVTPSSPESVLDLKLAVALLKGEKFDLVVQKSTELGVKAVLPVVTRFADIHLKDQSDAERRVFRWQRIALEAAKQSGRAFVPPVSAPSELSQLLESRPSESRTHLMFSERGGQPLADTIEDIVHVHSVTALVGSEGGWADEELGQAIHLGWKIVTLGGRILRAETAAITITALLQHRLGDLR